MCPDCLQRRADLIAKATEWLSQREYHGNPLPEAKANEIVNAVVEGRGRHYCEGCGKRIPQYHNMQNCGFQSASIHHYHKEVPSPEEMEGGLPGGKTVEFKVPVHLELCHECYQKDHAAVYPNSPIPTIANARFD